MTFKVAQGNVMRRGQYCSNVVYALILLTLSVVPCAGHELSLDPVGHFATTFAPPGSEDLGDEYGDAAETVRGVLDGFKLWPAGKLLDVCFLNAAPDRRAVFASAAQDWLVGTSLRTDFGWPPNFRSCEDRHKSDIRISFSWGGSWSTVGTDSLKAAPRASLNIDYAQSGALENYDRKKLKRLILHEFGHALGLEHEHQSPEAHCDEAFDWQYMYASMGWSKEQVDRNMKALVAGPRSNWIVTPYDPTSIMHYALPEKFFKQGKDAPCFIHENNELSSVDRKLVQETYPPLPETTPVASNDAILQDRADQASTALSSLELPPDKLGKIGLEIAKTLVRGKHNIQKTVTLDISAANETRGLSADPPQIKNCADGAPGIACAYTDDGSRLSISIDPR